MIFQLYREKHCLTFFNNIWNILIKIIIVILQHYTPQNRIRVNRHPYIYLSCFTKSVYVCLHISHKNVNAFHHFKSTLHILVYFIWISYARFAEMLGASKVYTFSKDVNQKIERVSFPNCILEKACYVYFGVIYLNNGMRLHIFLHFHFRENYL